MLISQIPSKKDSIFVEKINKKIGKAINENNLIEEGDKIMLALSGGKDSMVLLEALAWRLRFAKEKYKLVAVHVKLNGLSYSIDKQAIKSFCEERSVEFHYVEDTVNNINLSKKTPCFICSHTRRKLLFEAAKNLNCNKIAFGHHMDDAVETLLMNMIYHSNISSIPPKVEMFDGQLLLIRPLITVRDSETLKYSEILKYPKLKSSCLFENKTKRKTISDLLKQVEISYPQAVSSIYASLRNIDLDYI
jgi:tRNA(Ile)-lysidine synthetase-like protein